MMLHDGAETAPTEDELGPEATRLLAAWARLRGDRPAPARHDLDLKQIAPLLPGLFIAERRAAGQPLAWRLAGTAVCRLFGRELTGSGFLACWPGFERSVVERFLHGVTHAHRQAVFHLRLRTDRDQPLAAEMIALPLVPRRGRMQVLGGLFTSGGSIALHHMALKAVEIRSARFLGQQEAALRPAADPLQARRKFRMIAGGLDLS